jgi:hypothetical protein
MRFLSCFCFQSLMDITVRGKEVRNKMSWLAIDFILTMLQDGLNLVGLNVAGLDF